MQPLRDSLPNYSSILIIDHFDRLVHAPLVTQLISQLSSSSPSLKIILAIDEPRNADIVYKRNPHTNFIPLDKWTQSQLTKLIHCLPRFKQWPPSQLSHLRVLARAARTPGFILQVNSSCNESKNGTFTRSDTNSLSGINNGTHIYSDWFFFYSLFVDQQWKHHHKVASSSSSST